MATDLPPGKMTGIQGSGSEKEGEFLPGTIKAEVFAKGEEAIVSFQSGGTGAATTSTTVPAGSGMDLLIPGTDCGTKPLTAKVSVYVKQASSAGHAQFTVGG
jgi:hypothetical protein